MPEISRIPIENVVLQLKSMNVDQIVNFPFPTSPDRSSLKSAENLLVQLGALDAASKKITTLGNIMAQIPILPRFSKM
jgi:ATP-dependent RNA helicase DHX37/DHR1